MNLERIKKDAPPMATHYCEEQGIYIHIDNGTWFFNGDWIQYDDSCRMSLVEL